MSEPASGGFSVLDGVGLVAGAAVASVHLRGALDETIFGPGWVIMLGTFVWVGVTSAGPFLYLLRRYARGQAGAPKVGDRLWGLLGLPWLLSALLQTGPREPGVAARPGSAAATLLVVGVGLVSLSALAVVWKTWVAVDPEKASETFSPPWTNRVGLLLAIAWPVQWGVTLVVIG